VSVSADLVVDARRDLDDVGALQYKALKLHDLRAIKVGVGAPPRRGEGPQGAAVPRCPGPTSCAPLGQTLAALLDAARSPMTQRVHQALPACIDLAGLAVLSSRGMPMAALRPTAATALLRPTPQLKKGQSLNDLPALDEGILFCTYDLLISGTKRKKVGGSWGQGVVVAVMHWPWPVWCMHLHPASCALRAVAAVPAAEQGQEGCQAGRRLVRLGCST
jgi:hypothetical protein